MCGDDKGGHMAKNQVTGQFPRPRSSMRGGRNGTGEKLRRLVEDRRVT
jgi:hypothetical protein